MIPTVEKPHEGLSSYLNWKDRTPDINESISKAFARISENSESQWGVFNGDTAYSIGGIQEHKLIRKIIQEAPPENKDFYVLDIGAGNFEWGRTLAKYLNAEKDIPKDIKIHIIGIRGENNLDKAVTELGCCKLYEFGQFQVEKLQDEFQKRGLQLANKVDLIVSRWCFRHLVDPVGTFTQAYDILRPKTGHLLLDGFHFLQENEDIEDKKFDEKMTRLCLEMGAPFLTRKHHEGGSINDFVMCKPDDQPCHLHKQYLGIEKLEGPGWDVGSGTITRFKELKKNDIEAISLPYEPDEYRGDKNMYERFRQNGLLHNSDFVWQPLQDKDIHKKTPPFHIAIASRDEEAIERYLKEGCDINESNDRGATPLHLAIEHNNYKLFSLLIEKGALTNLCTRGGYTLLHTAMQYDMSGCFIQDLIAAGADVNKPSKEPLLMPLDYAIKHKNVKAAELLLAKKANVSYANHVSLESDPTFSSIQHLLPKRWDTLKEFETIIDHIKEKRDWVLFTDPNESFSYICKRSPKSGIKPKLIRVTVNPEMSHFVRGYLNEIAKRSKAEVSRGDGKSIKSMIPSLELRIGY